MVVEVPWLAAVFSLVATGVFGAELAAQTVKLSGALVQPGTGDVLEGYAFDPSGERVVFRADVELDDVFELYSAPSDAAAAALRLAPGVDVGNFAVGDGLVLLVADASGSGVVELHRVPILGGVPSTLSGSLVAGGDVQSVKLTPDRSRAVFLADKVVDGRLELFGVPVDGSALPVQLDPAPPAGAGAVTQWWIAPDGMTVVFARQMGFAERLWAVPILGGPPAIELASIPGIFGERAVYLELAFTADGQHAVFTAVEELDGDVFTAWLGSVPIDGSSAWTILEQEDFFTPTFRIGAGERVVYMTPSAVRSVELDGSQPVLHDPAGSWVPDAFALTPDGTTVVFGARTTAQGGLFRAPVSGAQPATMLVSGPAFFVAEIDISPARAVYLTAEGIRSVLLDGSQPPVLLNPPGSPYPLFGIELLPDGSEVVYRGSVVSGVIDLHAVPADGSALPRRISAPMSGTKDVGSFQIAPTGAHVAYRADQTNESTFELVAASLAGAPPAPYVAVPGGPVLGDVIGFRMAPNGKSVVYHADQEEDENSSLYHTRAAGQTEPTLVVFSSYTQPSAFAFSPSGEYVVHRGTNPYLISSRPADSWASEIDSLVSGSFAISPDGARIVYQRGFTGEYDLRSAPIDDSAAPVNLDTPFGFARSVTAFEIAPDSQRVAYRADQDSDNVFELYSASIDTTASAVKLNPALSGARDVAQFRISPAEGLVVYVADQDVNNQEELYSVPLDGSQSPVRLNTTLVVSGDVTTLALTPDGGRVIYRADQVADERYELFMVDLLAPGPPVAIPLTALAGTQSVQVDFQVAPGGAHVFFRADTNTPGVIELFRVPVDGSTAPAQLSAPLTLGGSVVSFALSPDGQRVVYSADQVSDELFELFAVDALGGSVLGLDPLPAFADVESFRIAPDSGCVVYRVDRLTDGVLELFGIPLDGSAPALRVNEPLPEGGNVEPDYAALARGAVVYRADQEEDERFELFRGRALARQDPPLRPAPGAPSWPFTLSDRDQVSSRTRDP